MYKRGVEFISVVILIGFVMIMAGIVFLFVNKIVSKNIEDVSRDAECNDVSIKILNACYDDKDIKINIESKSIRDIDNGFLFRVYGDKNEVLPSLPFTILKGLNIQDVVVPYDISLGDLNEIEVIPKIRKVNGDQVICSLQSDKKSVVFC